MLWKLWFLYDLKWSLNGHFKPFRGIRSIRNEFVASILSSLSPPRPHIHPGSKTVWNFGSDMGQKSILNDILNLFRALGSVRNGFVSKFPRKWWYREVEGSFLSPFYGHFCFSRIRTIFLRGCNINISVYIYIITLHYITLYYIIL